MPSLPTLGHNLDGSLVRQYAEGVLALLPLILEEPFQDSQNFLAGEMLSHLLVGFGVDHGPYRLRPALIDA